MKTISRQLEYQRRMINNGRCSICGMEARRGLNGKRLIHCKEHYWKQRVARLKDLKPIRVFHCPKCEYESGMKIYVVRHIKEKHLLKEDFIEAKKEVHATSGNHLSHPKKEHTQ